MKKYILGLIAIITISNLSFSQATLEHSYLTNNWNWELTNSFITDEGTCYYTVNSDTGVVLIYNSSHSLIKTVNISNPDGYSISRLYAFSDKLFNNDATIEFIVLFLKYDLGVSFRALTLYNDNGDVLQQFGNKETAYIVKENVSEFKLITVSEEANSKGYYYDVYSLPRTTLNVSPNKFADKTFNAYPNPTGKKISITNNLENGQSGTLEVFDTSGKKIIQKNVIGTNNEIDLDVTNLSNGVYIYKLNGQTNRFIKK